MKVEYEKEITDLLNSRDAKNALLALQLLKGVNQMSEIDALKHICNYYYQAFKNKPTYTFWIGIIEVNVGLLGIAQQDTERGKCEDIYAFVKASNIDPNSSSSFNRYELAEKAVEIFYGYPKPTCNKYPLVFAQLFDEIIINIQEFLNGEV